MAGKFQGFAFQTVFLDPEPGAFVQGRIRVLLLHAEALDLPGHGLQS